MIKIFSQAFIFIAIGFASDYAFCRSANDQAQVSVEGIDGGVKREKKKVTGPTFSRYGSLEDSIEMELIANIDQTLAYLNKTVKELPRKSRARLDMYIKIMNLSLEQAAYVGTQEENAFNKAWTNWEASGKKGPMPRQSHAKSAQYWRNLQLLSQDVMREFPTSPGVDRVYYIGTLGLQFLGQEAAAAKGFLDILRRFPNSPVIPDSAFSLGEYYFNTNQFAKAVPYYVKASSYPQSKKEGWSSFKLGWCYFNLSQHQKALNSWKRTIAYSNRAGADKAGRLRDEALRDMVNAFAELKMVDEAIRFYKENSASEYLPVLMLLLSQAFADHGNFGKAIDVSYRLISSFPHSKEALTAQIELLDLYYGLVSYDQLFNEIEKTYKFFGPNSAWATKQDEELVKTTAERIRKLSLYYPKMIHKTAQKTGNKKNLAAAVKGYFIYLNRNPRSLDLAEILEYMGDIEYFNKNYSKAGKYYFDITMMGDKAAIFDEKGRLKTNIHQRSAKNMIDAYNKDFAPELARLERMKPNFKVEARTLSSSARNFVKACELYSKWYPKDIATVKNCDIYSAEVYYRSSDKKPALAHLWLVAEKYRNAKEGLSAAESIMSIVADDEEEALSAAKKLLSFPEYARTPLGAKLKELLRNQYLTKIKNEPSAYKRGGLYEAQAKQEPNDKDADKLWNNAATEYLKAGAVNRAIIAYEQLIRLYPKSIAVPIALLQLGQILEGQMDFPSASNYYLAYAGRFGSEPAAKTARQKACYLLIASHKPQAVNVCRTFARQVPEFAEAALSRLIVFLGRTSALDQMIEVIERDYLPLGRVDANKKIIALHRVIVASGAESRHGSNARSRIMQIYGSSRGQVNGQALRYVGEIVFAQNRGFLERFTAMRLNGGTAPKLQASIQAMLAQVGNLERSYGKVFQTQDSYWGVAAFYQLGFAYENFAEKLMNPPQINGVKSADVKNQLQGSVTQLQKKAKDYYQQGWQTAQRFSIFSEWTAKTYDAISRLAGSNVKFLDWVYDPDFVGSPNVEEYVDVIARD